MSKETTELSNEGMTEALDSPEALVDRTLNGRYRLESLLHMGGMGIVYDGRQLNIDRRVAVKILRPTMADQPGLVRRFEREIDVIGRLVHPNIVTMFEADEDAGGLKYIAMEFIDGVTLRDALETRKLSSFELVEVFVQICDALAAAHSADIIHRDLKFENIMVQRYESGRLGVKLLDFGVAKTSSEHTQITKSGEVPGTPGIIAPELLTEGDPEPCSDLYSLGVLLYTALSGEPPFQAENDMELMQAHANKKVPELYGNVAPDTPDALIELTYDLLEKNPDERPANPSQVRERLLGIQRRMAVGSGADHVEYDTKLPHAEKGPDQSDEKPKSSNKIKDRGPVVSAVFGDEPLVAPRNILLILTGLLGGLTVLLIFVILTTLISH